jgi:ferredoxin
MIVGEQKPIEEIGKMIADYKTVLILGCNTCIAVCHAGGEKEVGILASALRIKNKIEGRNQKIEEASIERQCEKEFIDEVADKIKKVDCVLSLACGVGPQTIVEFYPDTIVFPGINTTFYGMPKEQGFFVEFCGGCGNCVLDKTAGICPIVRCSKSMLNGPCGGSQDGKCEVNPEIQCAWQLIYDRLKAQGRLDVMDEILPPKDWKTARHGGPRKMVREDLMIDDRTESEKENKKEGQKKEGEK